MTINEAIKLLEDDLKGGSLESYDRYVQALKLGIEALKYAKTSRDPDGVPPYLLLPGESVGIYDRGEG